MRKNTNFSTIKKRSKRAIFQDILLNSKNEGKIRSKKDKNKWRKNPVGFDIPNIDSFDEGLVRSILNECSNDWRNTIEIADGVQFFGTESIYKVRKICKLLVSLKKLKRKRIGRSIYYKKA